MAAGVFRPTSLLRRISQSLVPLSRAFQPCQKYTGQLDECHLANDSGGEREENVYTDDRKLRMNDSHFIPRFGLGVWKMDQGPETVNAIAWALKVGYRQIDTASRYGNEESVGEAVRGSGLAREEVFVTTKLYDDRHGYHETLKAFNDSLSRLGLDYVDLYLIHSPMNGKILPTWEAMIELQEKGFVRVLALIPKIGLDRVSKSIIKKMKQTEAILE